MRIPDVNYFNIGPRLTLTFAVLVGLILGGNGLLVWQFHIARVQTDRLTGVSQQAIVVLRLRECLLAFHQRLDELAQAKDAHRMVTEAEPLRRALLEQTQRTRSALARLPPEIRVDPAFLPTLRAIEITLPSQLEAITALATSGDWENVRFRVSNELKPLETQSSGLVNSIDREVSEELTQAVANMGNVQRRIILIVPITAISTFFIASFFGWAVTRRMIELRFDERLAERTRMARDLHDTFLQTIQGSKLVADDALELSNDPVRMRRAMEQLSVWLVTAMQEGRAALNSLRTATTQTNDLAEALRRVTEDGLIPASMTVTFSVVGDAREMHPIVRDEIYRIGYEAIRNACVHSRASRLEVELRYSRNLALRVNDNGTGIDPATADGGKDGHFGLQSMRERAARIGGNLTLASSSNLGTEIRLTVPGAIIFQKRTPVGRSLSKKIRTLFR
jgi:signal transduction histidine kinase